MAASASDPVRVLLVSRLFTGLIASLESGQWRPTGVPAIYKLVEGLAADPGVEPLFVFTVKDEPTARKFPRRQEVTLAELGARAVILPYHRNGLVRELSHLWWCLWLWFRHRARVSYFTNANFATGAVFARLGLGRTVLRFMGMFPFHKRLVEDSRGAVLRWLFRSPWSQVVCTLEGSGAEHYLPQLVGEGSPVAILLNGVDAAPPPPADIGSLKAKLGLQADLPVVLFLGRLETYKGCDDFVDGMLMLLQRRPGCCQAVVLGDGQRLQALRQKVAEAGKEQQVHVIGAVPHAQVPSWMAATDVYVSLNRHGNLANTNLEAMAAGRCMLVLAADPATHVDLVTEQVLPISAAPRVSRSETPDSLADEVEKLLADPQAVERYAVAVRAVAAAKLKDWPARINHEIEMILGDTPRRDMSSRQKAL